MMDKNEQIDEWLGWAFEGHYKRRCPCGMAHWVYPRVGTTSCPACGMEAPEGG